MSDSYERIAIVTGATSGIGEAVAKKLASAGFGVVGNGRNADRLYDLEKRNRSRILRCARRCCRQRCVGATLCFRKLPFQQTGGHRCRQRRARFRWIGQRSRLVAT